MRPAAGLARGGTSRYRIVSYRIEKKTLISYRYRIESKKSLSLLTGANTQIVGISGSKALYNKLELLWGIILY